MAWFSNSALGLASRVFSPHRMDLGSLGRKKKHFEFIRGQNVNSLLSDI
jgi:hypothetical protein